MTRTYWLGGVIIAFAAVMTICVGLFLWYVLSPRWAGTPPAPTVIAVSEATASSTVTVDVPAAPTPRRTPSATTGNQPSPTVEPDATREPVPPRPGVADLPEESPLPAQEEEIIVNTLEAVQGTTIPQRDLYDIAIRFGRIPADTPRAVSEVDPGYRLGDVLTFNVSNIATEENFTADATLRAQTPHASWWVANDVTVNQAALEASA
ncbi:MAG: hypothetical protein ACRDIB_18750, partial [Ardenticatenaceae bacterium]